MALGPINLFGPMTLFPYDGVDGNSLYVALASADFDQDGYDDFVATRTNCNCVIVLLNQSGTGFVQVWSSGSNAVFNDKGIVVGDYNGDGFPDILSAHANNSGPARVWINQIANNPVCASDLDKTGNVDFSDLLFVLNEWGECGQQIN